MSRKMWEDLRWCFFVSQILPAPLPKPRRLETTLYGHHRFNKNKKLPKICSRGIQPSAFIRSNQWQIISNSRSRSHVAMSRPWKPSSHRNPLGKKLLKHEIACKGEIIKYKITPWRNCCIQRGFPVRHWLFGVFTLNPRAAIKVTNSSQHVAEGCLCKSYISWAMPKNGGKEEISNKVHFQNFDYVTHRERNCHNQLKIQLLEFWNFRIQGRNYKYKVATIFQNKTYQFS